MPKSKKTIPKDFFD